MSPLNPDPNDPEQRREAYRKRDEWRKRSKGLKRTGRLRRRSHLNREARMKESNPARRRRRFREAFESEDRVQFTHDSGCVVGVECYGRMHAHHVTSRGAGGGPDDLVCLCEKHHREVHRIGRETVEKKYAISLAHESAYLSGLWAKHTEDG